MEDISVDDILLLTGNVEKLLEFLTVNEFHVIAKLNAQSHDSTQAAKDAYSIIVFYTVFLWSLVGSREEEALLVLDRIASVRDRNGVLSQTGHAVESFFNNDLKGFYEHANNVIKECIQIGQSSESQPGQKSDREEAQDTDSSMKSDGADEPEEADVADEQEQVDRGEQDDENATGTGEGYETEATDTENKGEHSAGDLEAESADRIRGLVESVVQSLRQELHTKIKKHFITISPQQVSLILGIQGDNDSVLSTLLTYDPQWKFDQDAGVFVSPPMSEANSASQAPDSKARIDRLVQISSFLQKQAYA
uniref:ARAD1D49808p n=1 Tax=Blastobotrys adeninivorans TaxID=409370 RepID=A0A060TE84_BLAAD